MAETQIEVITSVERRRRWSSAEKERLVAASLEPGCCGVASPARPHMAQLCRSWHPPGTEAIGG
jgi:transposase